MLTKVERLMREDITKDVTQKVTREVTQKVTESVSESIAKKMLKKGDDVDTVAECTSLSKDIVIKLVEDIAREKEEIV